VGAAQGPHDHRSRRRASASRSLSPTLSLKLRADELLSFPPSFARPQTLHHLAFHPSYPHLLASASEDKTIRLWDPTLPWSSDAAVSRRARRPAGGSTGETGGGKKGGRAKVGPQSKVEERIREAEGRRTSRPRVEGELLGVLAEGGHEKAVMSCVRRSLLPLALSLRLHRL